MGRTQLGFLLLGLLASCNKSLSFGTSSSTTPSSSSASSSSSGGGDHGAAWKRFAVRGVMLGGVTDKVGGEFVCDTDVGKYHHSCVQFLDERCKGRPTKVKSIGFTSDIPAGQSCFLDASTGGTYLDRKFISPPLSSIRVIGTDTRTPRTYQIEYTFAKDVLEDDSNLGKALIAKYGKPTSKSAPISMFWDVGGLQMNAACGSTEGPSGEYCSIRVEDSSILEAERARQQTADAEQAKHAGPAAPTL